MTEAEYGIKWRALAWEEGYRPAKPPRPPRAIKPVGTLARTRADIIEAMMRDKGEVTFPEICEAMSLTHNQAVDAMQVVRVRSKITWRSIGGNFRAYSFAMEAAE